MQIFEYPYVVISIFALGFVILAAIGLYFAVRGVKTANGNAENDFITISKIESSFKRQAKMRVDRCVMYINISSDCMNEVISSDS